MMILYKLMREEEKQYDKKNKKISTWASRSNQVIFNGIRVN